MSDLLTSLTPILLIMLCIAATSVFVFIRSPARTVAKALLIPAALVAAIAVPVVFTSQMGYAVPLPPPAKSTFIAHRVVVVASKKKNIELWLATKDGQTRLYITVWSKELEEMLEKAAAGRQQGLQGELNMRKKPGGAGKNPGSDQGNGSGYEFDLRLLRPEDIMPKGDAPDRLNVPPGLNRIEPEQLKKWT